MAIQGFDKDFYLNAKLAQLQSNSETAADWAGKDAAFLEARFSAVGLTAEEHYEQYGYQEDLAPNAFFNPAEYIRAKATDMFNDANNSYLTIDAAAEAFVNLWGGNVYNHYLQYGEDEGINPSNSFDVSGYYEAKLAQLQAEGNTEITTVEQVKEAFETAGLTALEHFLTYGQTEEGLSAPAVPADEQVNVDTSVPGQVFSLTAATDDVLVGTSGIDTFEGDAATYQDSDRIIDSSSADSDVFNLTESVTVTPDAVNVENINITQNSVSAVSVNASKIIGADTLTVTRGDVTISGTTVNGNKAVSVTNADASQVAKIIAGAGTTSLDVDSTAADKAGHVIDASTVTGDVTVDGAATISADNSTGTVAIDVVSNGTTAETSKASVIDAAKAGTVTTHAGLTGSVTINAAAASTVAVNDAQGGATVNAGTASTADTTITVTDIDASGATIVTGTGSAISAEKEIDIVLRGTAASTDAASVSANGTIDLDIDGTTAHQNVDILTLSGNGSDVTYRLSAPNAGTFSSLTKAGTNAVTVSGDLSEFSATTINGIDTVTINAGGGSTLDASKWSNVTNVNLGVNNSGNAITAMNGTKWTLTTATQTTGLNFDFAATATDGSLTIVSGDVNGSSNGAVGTATVNAFNAAAASDTTVGDVTLEAFESNFVATGTTLAKKQNLIITGDEDVTLGIVAADSVNASASSGIIKLTAGADLDVVTTGTGKDDLTLNGAAKHTVTSGSGDDTITVTQTQNETSVDAGAGNDTIHADETDVVYVAAGGAGDDNIVVSLVSANNDFDAYVIGGDGTDTLTFDSAVAHDFTTDGSTANDTDADKFTFAGIEKVNITALNNALTLTDTQFANNNVFEITAAGGDDTFAVKGGTTATTINGSGVSVASGSSVTIEYTGSTKSDTITGGNSAETIKQSLGADSIVGGDGADTYQLNATGLQENGSTEAAAGYIVNLGGSTITSAEVFAGISKYLGEGASSVAAGSVAYAYASADSSTINNSAVVDSVSGVENVVGSDLSDYIVASDNASTITGGKGADYIKLGGAADTVVFADTAANNGQDTIQGFNFGAGNDAVDFDAFLTAAATFYDVTGAGTAIGDDGVAATSTGAIALSDITNKVALVTTADISTQTVNEATLFGTGKAFAAEGTTALNTVLLVGETSGTDGVKAYYVTDGTAADDMTVQLVGTFSGVSLADVHADNLA